MKKTVLAMAACSLAYASYAQTFQFGIPQRNKKWEAQVASILHQQSATSSAEKTNQSKQRLTGISTYELNSAMTGLEISDSTHFKYSGLRGSSFDKEFMQYNYEMAAPGVNFDSLFYYEDLGSGIQLSEKGIAKYNTAGQKDTVVKQIAGTAPNSFINDERYRFQYNTQGNFSSTWEDYWNTATSAWVSGTKHIYTYNAGNKLVADTSYYVSGSSLIPSERTYNTYDGSGNLTVSVSDYHDGTSWKTSSKTTYTYYSNNKLRTSLLQTANAQNILENSNLDSFGYTTGVDYFTYQHGKEWDPLTSAWVPMYTATRHLNTAMQTDTMNIYEASLGFTYKGVFTYNSFGNPISNSVIIDFPGFPVSEFMKMNYYYETYNDPTAVKDMVKTTDVVLYPNPATAELNIRRNKTTNDEVMTIWNTAGQKLMQHKLDNTTTAISVAQLTPGMYWITLQQGGQITARQSFIKQ